MYGTGASQDISGLIDAANSTEVRIDTNGNDISWASYSQELGNAALVKLGGGSLDISVTAAAQDTTTYTGAISVTEGQLTYNITLPAGSQATRVWSGALSIAQGAALQFNEARAVNRTTVLTLSGAISGAGDLILGDKEAPTNPGGGATRSAAATPASRAPSSWWATAPTLTGTKWASPTPKPWEGPAWNLTGGASLWAAATR